MCSQERPIVVGSSPVLQIQGYWHGFLGLEKWTLSQENLRSDNNSEKKILQKHMAMPPYKIFNVLLIKSHFYLPPMQSKAGSPWKLALSKVSLFTRNHWFAVFVFWITVPMTLTPLIPNIIKSSVFVQACSIKLSIKTGQC